MAKEKTTETATATPDYKAKFDDQLMRAEGLKTDLDTAVAELKRLQATAAADQEMKEECLRLLWLARFVLQPCKTKKDIDNFMERLRVWIGKDRAEEVERKLRK